MYLPRSVPAPYPLMCAADLYSYHTWDTRVKVTLVAEAARSSSYQLYDKTELLQATGGNFDARCRFYRDKTELLLLTGGKFGGVVASKRRAFMGFERVTEYDGLSITRRALHKKLQPFKQRDSYYKDRPSVHCIKHHALFRHERSLIFATPLSL